MCLPGRLINPGENFNPAGEHTGSPLHLIAFENTIEPSDCVDLQAQGNQNVLKILGQGAGKFKVFTGAGVNEPKQVGMQGL